MTSTLNDLNRLNTKLNDSHSKEIMGHIYANLKNITNNFSVKLNNLSSNLTTKGLYVCNMLINGLSSKEIAYKLSISLSTIEKHRNNIRKKLNISNKKVNLVKYLKEINQNRGSKNIIS